MKRIIALALTLIFAAVPVNALTFKDRDFDLTQFVVVDYDGNVDLTEHLSREIEVERKAEEAIDVFWDCVLKEDATEDQIDAVRTWAAKTCYLPKREEYYSIMETAREQLKAKEKEKEKADSELLPEIMQFIVLRYNENTKEKMSDYTYEDIEWIQEKVKQINNEATRQHYNDVIIEMIYAK